MNDTLSRRLAAYDRAQAISLALGIVCPICILETARSIDIFLETGRVDGEHLSAKLDEAEEDQNAKLIPHDYKGPKIVN